MKYLQLLIGGLHDVLVYRSEGSRFSDAVFFACFGVFPNVATVLILLAAVVRYFFRIEYELVSFPGSKVLWVLLMGLIFVLLISSRARILAADRARFTSRSDLKIFLTAYYLFTYSALLGSYSLYAIV